MSEFNKENFLRMQQEELANANYVIHQLQAQVPQDPAGQDLTAPLHSFEIKIFSPVLPWLIVRSDLIEQYPHIRGLNYQPPQILPAAKSRLNGSQAREDGTLKSVKYFPSSGHSGSRVVFQ
ncbi:hypothetical protein [Parasitella parasitica]|uniref:Uncharacterized protein n=1 Tax=Parasitella parasitica TaxID=35722 RepID=A0A0B7MVH3_9FUNG|nr:hypothetical protein [Parasitella parasitica]